MQGPDPRAALPTPRPGEPAQTPATSVEERISAAARRFDLCALLDLLAAHGYRDSDIELVSHQTALHQSSEIEAVRFERQPRRRVVITVNLGWLAPQGALPTYFQKILLEQRDESLSGFLGFFCHHILRSGIRGQFPERDRRLFTAFGRTLQKLRSLLGLRSPSTVHWVFSQLFPELEVCVRRTVLTRRVRTRGMVLGTWDLGDGAVCGGITTLPVHALEVRLLGDEPTTGTGEPWAKAAEVRLRDAVFPILSVGGLFLHVLLILRDQQGALVLKPRRYLGYEPLDAGSGGTGPTAERSARTIVLWSDEVPAHEPDGL
ncbi:MAG: type VI secretion system baseplate subunit TssG [Polyangia bacterium]